MAARGASDFAQAWAAGGVPGEFSADRRVYEFPPVPAPSSLRERGRLWAVRVCWERDGERAAFPPELFGPGAAAQAAGGVGVVATETRGPRPGGGYGPPLAAGLPTYVERGKNLGKANATTPATQALREAWGLYRARLRASAASAAVAAAAPSEAPGRPGAGPCTPPPMLLKKEGGSRDATLGPADFAEGLTVQRKLNGVRLVAFLERPLESVRLYSRTAAEYPGLAALRDELLGVLAEAPPVPDDLLGGGPGGLTVAEKRDLYAPAPVYLDGELYLHGRGLSWISGQARKSGDEGLLQFHVFDCFFPQAKAAGEDLASARRQAYLDLLFAGRPAEALVRRVENARARDRAELVALERRFLGEGYEGAVARKDGAGYVYGLGGYHAAAALKLKPLADAEFPVVGYGQGRRGKDLGALIWECAAPAGGRFTVVPKSMTYAQRYHAYACLGREVPNAATEVARGGAAWVSRFERDFAGLPLTVEFAERSSTGKPTQAKAVAFRTYEAGPGNDPLARLFSECPMDGGAAPRAPA